MSYLDPAFSDARASIQIVPLASAWLCEDCGNISNPSTDACPVCGSGALLGLARVLDRPRPQETESCSQYQQNYAQPSM